MRRLLVCLLLLCSAHLYAQGRGTLWILGKIPDRNPYGCTASTSGTYVGPAASITNSTCAVWTLGSGTTPNIVILRNGSQAAGAFGAQILYYLGELYVQGDDLNWYLWDEALGVFGFYSSTDPSMSVTPVGYFVSTTGSNSNDCTAAQNVMTPKQTLNGAMTCLTSATVGKTLWVRGGAYAESLINVIPSGTSSSNIVRIIAYPGETPTMTPGAGAQRAIYFDGANAYITVDGININCASCSDASVFMDDRAGSATQLTLLPPHHITFQNGTVAHRNNLGGGNTNAAMLIAGHDIRVTNMDISGIGGPYAVYVHGQNQIVENNNIHGTASAGIQVYANQGDCGACSSPSAPNNNIIRNNYIHDITVSNQFGVDDGRMWGIIVYGATNTLIYNNIIAGVLYSGTCTPPTCTPSGAGLAIFGTSTGVYNNTVYNNSVDGISISASSPSTVVRNNIVYLSGTAYVNSNGAGTTESNRLYDINPIFVSAGSNYRLQSTSPARDTGTPLASSFTTDLEGTPRPQGPAWDIGAYEYH